MVPAFLRTQWPARCERTLFKHDSSLRGLINLAVLLSLGVAAGYSEPASGQLDQ